MMIKKRILIFIITFIISLNYAFSGPPLIEKHVSKSNGGFTGLFNLYQNVESDREYQDNGYVVDLACWDPGFERCVEGEYEVAPPDGIPHDHWDAVADEMQTLDQYSEQEAQEGNLNGEESHVLAMELSSGDIIYYVINIEWMYSEDNPTTGEVYLVAYRYEEYPPSN